MDFLQYMPIFAQDVDMYQKEIQFYLLFLIGFQIEVVITL